MEYFRRFVIGWAQVVLIFLIVLGTVSGAILGWRFGLEGNTSGGQMVLGIIGAVLGFLLIQIEHNTR